MEAECVSCLKPCAPMISSGWGICKQCRDRPVYDFTALHENVPSRKGRDYVKRAVRAHLNSTEGE